MLNFNDVAIRRGPRLLFSGATFSLFRGEKVAITGENGSGKSSLLCLVQGELQPDAGTFEMPAQLAIAHVSQELVASERAALEFVIDGDPELRAIERAIESTTADAHSGDAGIRLEHPVSTGSVYAYTDMSTRSQMNGLLYTSKEFELPSLTQWGLRLGYTWADDKYDVAAFCRNCGNQIRTIGVIDFDNLTGYINDPRIYGAQFRAKF